MDPDEVATGEIETVALRGWQQHGILRPLADSSCYNFRVLSACKGGDESPSGPELGVQRRTDFGIIVAIGAGLMR